MQVKFDVRGDAALKTPKPVTTIENFSEEDIRRLEDEFLQHYNDGTTKKRPMRTLLRICKGQYRRLLVSALFCALQLSATLFIPVATANVIDALTRKEDNCVEQIILNLGITLFLLLINYPLQQVYMRARNEATRSIEATLRGAIIAKLQLLTINFNKQMESGRIHSKIMRDVESIRALITNLHTTGVHIIVNLAAIIAVLLIKGEVLMLAFFALCGPAAALTAKIVKKKLRVKNSEYRHAMEQTNARVVDMVELIPVTKAHALEDTQMYKINRQISDTAKIGYELDKVTSQFIVSNWLVMQIFSVLCLVLTAILTLYGRMSVGDMTLYQSYFGKLVTYISSITGLLPIITTGIEAVNSVGEILDSGDTEDDTGKEPFGKLRGEYHFANVTFAYRDEPDRMVLKGLDLHVNAGETVALVGESGSGKSTIVNLVTGFDMYNDGQLTVDGKKMKDIRLKDYRRQIAVVLQNSILFSGTIRDNITYGKTNVSDEQLDKIIDLACLRDVIDAMPNGLDTVVGEHGNRLSGGQRQRISIARALIRNPQVIIFDEATSALDTVSEKHIQEAIDNLSKGKTTFIVAHRLSTIKNADKIAVIEDGRCVEFGTYDELLEKKGAFYRFRQMQV
jgi:ATP-binding cassette subfamily B protein